MRCTGALQDKEKEKGKSRRGKSQARGFQGFNRSNRLVTQKEEIKSLRNLGGVGGGRSDGPQLLSRGARRKRGKAVRICQTQAVN